MGNAVVVNQVALSFSKVTMLMVSTYCTVCFNTKNTTVIYPHYIHLLHMQGGLIVRSPPPGEVGGAKKGPNPVKLQDKLRNFFF